MDVESITLNGQGRYDDNKPDKVEMEMEVEVVMETAAAAAAAVAAEAEVEVEAEMELEVEVDMGVKIKTNQQISHWINEIIAPMFHAWYRNEKPVDRTPDQCTYNHSVLQRAYNRNTLQHAWPKRVVRVVPHGGHIEIVLQAPICLTISGGGGADTAPRASRICADQCDGGPRYPIILDVPLYIEWLHEQPLSRFNKQYTLQLLWALHHQTRFFHQDEQLTAVRARGRHCRNNSADSICLERQLLRKLWELPNKECRHYVRGHLCAHSQFYSCI